MASGGWLVSLRRAVKLAGVVLVLPALVGATYQGVANALERRAFPRPGRMVDAGGHQLHIACSGRGGPTVLLEAPAGAGSAAWGAVQPRFATAVRTCSYDRSGLGWSESGDRRFDPARVPGELHALLTGAQEPGPYVVVGAGLGASFARMFAAAYPAETRALVLLDDPAATGHRPSGGERRFAAAAPWLARVGILRAQHALAGRRQNPDGPAATVRAFLNRPDHLTRSGLELARWDDAVALSAEVPAGVPVVHLPGGDADATGLLLTAPAQAEPVLAAVAGFARRGRQP